RVDREGPVIQRHRAYEEPPNQPLPAADQVATHCQRESRHDVPVIEPSQLREPGKVLDVVEIGRLVPGAEDPTDMSPPEAVLSRRMNCAFAISVLVVLAVMCGPPQWTLLSGRATEHRKQKLKHAARGIAAMRKVSMVTCCKGEHSDQVHRDA